MNFSTNKQTFVFFCSCTALTSVHQNTNHIPTVRRKHHGKQEKSWADIFENVSTWQMYQLYTASNSINSSHSILYIWCYYVLFFVQISNFLNFIENSRSISENESSEIYSIRLLNRHCPEVSTNFHFEKKSKYINNNNIATALPNWLLYNFTQKYCVTATGVTRALIIGF